MTDNRDRSTLKEWSQAAEHLAEVLANFDELASVPAGSVKTQWYTMHLVLAIQELAGRIDGELADIKDRLDALEAREGRRMESPQNAPGRARALAALKRAAQTSFPSRDEIHAILGDSFRVPADRRHAVEAQAALWKKTGQSWKNIVAAYEKAVGSVTASERAALGRLPAFVSAEVFKRTYEEALAMISRWRLDGGPADLVSMIYALHHHFEPPLDDRLDIRLNVQRVTDGGMSPTLVAAAYIDELIRRYEGGSFLELQQQWRENDVVPT